MSILNKFIPTKVKDKILLKQHEGDKYTCPYCHYSSKDLESIGSDFEVLVTKQVVGGGKRHGGCYSCGSSDRERLLYAYLIEELKITQLSSGLRILHVAPEKRLTKVLTALNLKNYICGDKFEAGYEYASNVVDVDILDLRFDSNSFDLILCNHVLEHIPDDIKAMKELHRVLAPGGRAILQVPISLNSESTFEDFSIQDPDARIEAFGQFDHVRIYGQDYVKRLSSAGFNVARINISSQYPKLGLNSNEDLFICTK